MDNKIKFINELKSELKKRNKFLDYLPQSDRITVDEIFTMYFNDIGNYGNNVREISRNITKKIDNIMLGYEYIKKGILPENVTVEKLIPIMCNHKEITYLQFMLQDLKNYHKQKDGTNEYYFPFITGMDKYKWRGIVALYELGKETFPITLKQYNNLTKNMKENEFMNNMEKNSAKLFLQELNNISHENEHINNFYLWNLEKYSTNTIILSMNKYFDKLVEITRYYDNKMYLYPISEKQFILFDGRINPNELLKTVEVISESHNIENLDIFEITHEGMCITEKIYGIVGIKGNA